jgi:hypothetical protein
MYRTDNNNNPTAFTTEIAKQAGLVEGVDFKQGSYFTLNGINYYTAFILGDAIKTTIRVLDEVGYYTKYGSQRWIYIAIPKFLWDTLTISQKTDIIGFHYQREGGIDMKDLFPNYGKL